MEICTNFNLLTLSKIRILFFILQKYWGWTFLAEFIFKNWWKLFKYFLSLIIFLCHYKQGKTLTLHFWLQNKYIFFKFIRYSNTWKLLPIPKIYIPKVNCPVRPSTVNKNNNQYNTKFIKILKNKYFTELTGCTLCKSGVTNMVPAGTRSPTRITWVAREDPV